MNFITKTDFNISDTGEATYKVQIRDFHLRMKNWPVGKVIQSEFFEIQDFLLHLEIFPNGQKDADKDCVSAFLHNDSKNACLGVHVGSVPPKATNPFCYQNLIHIAI